MRFCNSSRFVYGFMFTLAAGSSVGLAQISPPTGPITRTRPTIVTGPAPIIIDQPGSYILGGNLIATGAVNGIEISASDVTLNLDGGVVDGANVGLYGIRVVGAQSNLYIHNGSITSWTSAGIHGSNASRSQYDRLRAEKNGTDAGGIGISAGRECLITNCVSSSNTGSGITATQVSEVRGCIVSRNNSAGIAVGHNSIVSHCTAEGNASTGISVGSRSIVSYCAATGNTTGISGSGSGLVEQCVVSSNSGTGIWGSANGTIAHCVISGGTKGINASVSISILNNKIYSVNGPGIYLDYRHNHVEGNRIEGCNNGIQTDNGTSTPGTENLIIKNTVRGSTGTGTPSANYDIISNNVYAQIINIAGQAGFVSTDPNANFER